MPFLIRLHVFSTFAMLALLPATRVAPDLIVALSHGMALISMPVRGLIDRVRKPVETMARRLNPALRIWPDED
jgi:hypothetical protein